MNDPVKTMRLVLGEVEYEYLRAAAMHGPMASGHEGWAVIREEVDELWELVKTNRGQAVAARAEAIQIAAMGIRYVLDLFGAET